MDDTIKDQTDTIEENKAIEYGTIYLKFSLTIDEAEAVINKPKGQVARNLRKYLNSVLKTFAKRVIDNKGKTVTNCNINIE